MVVRECLDYLNKNAIEINIMQFSKLYIFFKGDILMSFVFGLRNTDIGTNNLTFLLKVIEFDECCCDYIKDYSLKNKII